MVWAVQVRKHVHGTYQRGCTVHGEVQREDVHGRNALSRGRASARHAAKHNRCSTAGLLLHDDAGRAGDAVVALEGGAHVAHWMQWTVLWTWCA